MHQQILLQRQRSLPLHHRINFNRRRLSLRRFQLRFHRRARMSQLRRLRRPRCR
jgi:hypothetical protein